LNTIKTADFYLRDLQNISYEFDAVGNVSGYTNAAKAYSTTQAYEYDNLYQLTYATGTYDAKPYGLTDFTSTYQQRYSYDSIGNIQTKSSEVVNVPAVSRGQALNYQLEYQYYANKPHQVEQIGQLWYSYDGNGNVIEERAGGHSAASAAVNAELQQEGNLYILDYGFGLIRHPDDDGEYSRQFVWDEENRLKLVTASAGNVEFLYGVDGQRTTKYTAHGESLYFNSMWSMTEDWPNFRQSKHVYLGTSRIATKLKIEGDDSTGYERVNTYYYHSDHLGSAQLITDFEGQTYEHIEYTPYGQLFIE